MKNIFFLDVDTQRDLMLPDGALYVPGSERLIPKLRQLFDFAKKHEITILSTALARPADDPEFSRHPPHCIAGTKGQRKLDDTLLPHPLVIPVKLADRSYPDLVRKHLQIILEKPGFDAFLNPALEKLLRVLPGHAIVFGVPTEHSVKLAALGLRRAGIKTAVVQNIALPLNVRAGTGAEEELRTAGVEFISLETLLGVQTPSWPA